MAIPKYNEFMKPILNLLSDTKEHNRNEMYQDFSIKFQLTQEEMEEWLPSGNQLVYKNRIGWALTYLKKAGLVISPARSIYKITEDGLTVLKENPAEINADYLSGFEPFNEFIKKSNENIGQNEKTLIDNLHESPQEQLDRAYKTISNSLTDELLQEIMRQSPDFFEKLVVDLLVAMGYGGSKIENSKVLGKSGDEGIDGIINEDKLGLDTIYIQAKQWEPTKTVGRPELQKFVGALTGQGATKGAFLTTAKFSNEAKEYVKKQHACKIALIDGDRLTFLMVEYNLGVSIENAYYLKKVDIDYFSNDIS